jgi:DNA-binding LacI/PurR family transcriptional regulator
VITDAFARPFEAAGGAVDIFPITRSEVGWQIPTEDIVAACARLDCFFCHMDELAVALYSGLYRNGIHPGRDVEIVSCNNERPLIQGLEPAPAEIDIHAEMVGRRAVEQLLWRLENLTASYARIELEPELVVAVA